MADDVNAAPHGFKETEIGPMPVDWDVAPIAGLCRLRRQHVDPTASPEMAYVGLQHIESGEPRLQDWGRSSDVKSTKARFFPGDVLYGKLRPYLDKAVLADFEGICSTDILVLRPHLDLTTPEFLVYTLHTQRFLSHAISTTSGTNLPRTRWTALRSFKIPLPPLPEQRRIAHVLSTIQRAIGAQDRVIAAAKELKRSLMQHLFTYGPAPEPAATKESEIGEIPASWAVARLGELARVVRGASPRPKGDPKYFSDEPTGIHWIMISDLTKYKKGKFITSTEEYLTQEGKNKSRYLTTGTFVVTNSGTVGIPAFLGINGCIHDGYLALLDIDGSRVNEEYLYYWFVLIRGYLERIAPRGTQANLNTTIAKNLQIPVPSLPLQREIAHVLSAVDRRIEAEEDRTAALQELFKSMLHQLMTGQLRVKDLEV